MSTHQIHRQLIVQQSTLIYLNMKLSVLLLFSALLVFSAAALCFQITVFGGTQKPSYVFNATLLTFSAVDLGDDSLRQDVEQLMEGDFRKARKYRQSLFLSTMDLRSHKFNTLWSESRKYLQDWWAHHYFEPEIMSNMTSMIAELLKSRRKYKTCAVVGNSGILLKSKHGETFDNHEFVIRLNNARIVGFEQFVGSKTSLSFTHSDILDLCSMRKGCFCHPYGENVPIIMYISHPVHFLDYTLCSSSHKARLLITDPRFDLLCARIVKYYSVKRFLKETGKSLEAWSDSNWGYEFHYSSGMQAVMFALGVCNKVSIVGFGKSDLAKHHYHDNEKNESSLHDYQAEYDLYEDLVNNPKAVPFVSYKFKFPPVIMHR